jgi:pimeloyl-ACP methyl ester carboxylesterase
MGEPEGGPGTSLLDVYYPKDEGPWPVVVMLHGGGGTKRDQSDLAAAAAKRGAVVFVPTWSRMDGEIVEASSSRELRAKLGAAIGDVAAAVRFARGTATSYGGDPERLTLFGFSYGAMGATMDAFTGARPAKSGLRGAGSTIPESLVVFDGDYLNATLPDEALARDPHLMGLTTPWRYLGKRVDFPITVINSGDLGLGRDVPDAWAKDSWLAVRDPSGELRRGLEQLGALENGFYFNEDGLELFAERLLEAGDTVNFVSLTDSQHTYQSEEDVETILDAIVPYPQP